jgi:site-specific DNA-methyltransferase (adenine-specific)
MLLHGDCLELMKQIPDGSVDMILTDPPYTMTKRGKSCRPNWMPSKMGENVFHGPIPNMSLWMQECFRVLKNDTHFYVFTNTNDLEKTLTVARQIGFRFHNVICMIKDTGMPNRWYYKQTELVLFFRKGKAKPINDLSSRDNVRVIMPKKKNGKVHITQKPLEFITKLITNSSKQSETVLDPFMGSGTTGVACVNTGRKFIGIEQDDKYFTIAQQRIEGSKQ